MVLVLPDEAIAGIAGVETLAPVVEEALVRQGRGEVERPERPHYPIGAELDGSEARGTGLVMPAYVHGTDYFATKLATVYEDNPERGLPTIHSQIVVGDARTGRPVAFMSGEHVTNVRTGCIGGLAARELATRPVTLGVLGAGAQARWQTRAIDALVDLDAASVYSPSDSRIDCAAALREQGIDAEPADTPRAAVAAANVVVTATTSDDPVFPADALSPGALVVAVGAFDETARELDPAVFDRAARVFADVPAEAAGIGDVRATDLTSDDLVSLASVFEGRTGRESESEILIVESVGTAVLDVAAATEIYDAAVENGVGTEIPL